MAIIVDISVPPDAFGLGSVFDEHPTAEIEVEPVVPTEEKLFPYVWITVDDDIDAFVTTLREHPATSSLTKLTQFNGRVLCEVSWESGGNRATAALSENHAGCITVTGTRDGWSLHLRFQNHEDAHAFNKVLTEAGVPVTLERIGEYAAFLAPSAAALSVKQREAVRLAQQEGYFGVPRECTIDELAAEAGVSTSAFSERLRRGLDGLAQNLDEE